MKRLKTISPSNLFLIFFILFTGCYCYVIFQKPLGDDQVLTSHSIKGVLKEQKKKEDTIELVIGSTLVYTDKAFSLGDRLSCEGKIEYPTSSTNFYLFDYRKYLASKKIYYIMNGECTVEKTNRSFWYAIKEKIEKVIEKRKSSRYLKAFLLGSTEEMSDEVLTSYQKNGIRHLFAVSGMHIQFFFALFFFLQKKRKLSLGLFLFLLFYAFLVSFSPSFLRAWLFPFFLLAGEKLGLSKKKCFLFFTCLFLLYNPYYLYHTGFLYSFTISFFLCFLEDYPKKPLFLISCLSFLASLPIQINTSFSVSLLGPVWNLLFVPIVSLFLFPFSFFALLFPVCDTVYAFLMTILENSSRMLSSWFQPIIFPHIPLWGVLLYYAYFLFLLHKIKRKEYKYIVGFILLLGILWIRPFLSPRGEVILLDVGQGDSILLLYPHRRLSILVDTGGTGNEGKIAERVLIPTLHAYGISKLDWLVLTHGDQDHMGEAISLLEKISVRQVFLNSGSYTELEEKLIDYLKTKNISYRQVSQAKISYRGEQFYFLNPGQEEENEDSLVLYLQIRGHSLLLMGDSGFPVEEELLEKYNLSIDLLKVGHHGSKYSTSEEFIKAINPEVCLISAGVNNRYGHPHEETLSRLQSCDTYVTSMGGAVKVKLGSSMLVQRVR